MRVRTRHTSVVVGAALALTFFAVFAQAVAGPGIARACSCVMPMPTIEEATREPNSVVVAGTIGPQQAERTPVQVDTWFHGPGPSEIIWLGFGREMTTSCDPVVEVGERRLLVLYRQDDGVFSYNPCVVSGVIGTQTGDAAFAAAQQLFGGEPLPTPQPTEPPTIVDAPGIDTARLYLVGVIGAAVLVFVVIGIVAYRRRSSA